MDKFKGKITHSHFYTSHRDYGVDEKIMVVGNLSSGIDVATDLAKRRSKVGLVWASIFLLVLFQQVFYWLCFI